MKEQFITVTVKDSDGKTYSQSWKSIALKSDAIRWTIQSNDLQFYVDVDKIIEVTIS